MTESARPDEMLEAIPVDPGPRGFPVVAWLVIVIFGAVIVTLQGDRAAAPEKAGRNPMASRLVLMQSQYVVAAAQFSGKQQAQLAEQLDQLQAEDAVDRLRIAIVIGELAGPEKAQQRLAELEEEPAAPLAQGVVVGAAALPLLPDRQPSAAQELRGILVRLYQDYEEKAFAGPALSDDERTRLRAELGWFGALALTPAESADPTARAAVLQPATRMFVTILAAVVGLGLVGLVGFIGLVVFAIFFFKGSIRPLVTANTGRGGLYVEIFALWLLLYFGLSFLLTPLLFRWLGGLTHGVTMLSSLVVLGWPLLRGLTWRQVRDDIGLTWGTRPILEPFLGVATYACALPLVLAAALMTTVLLKTALGKDVQAPVHPMSEEILRPGQWGRLQIFLLACVCAPLVEEILFRGLLYRHLREATHRWGQAGSVAASALLVSFVFAVIHPQGVFGVPLLAALATAFTLAREWRGTLVPAMVAHGINNGVSLLGAVTLFGD